MTRKTAMYAASWLGGQQKHSVRETDERSYMFVGLVPESDHVTDGRDFSRNREAGQEDVVDTHGETHLGGDVPVTHLDEATDIGSEHSPV